MKHKQGGEIAEKGTAWQINLQSLGAATLVCLFQPGKTAVAQQHPTNKPLRSAILPCHLYGHVSVAASSAGEKCMKRHITVAAFALALATYLLGQQSYRESQNHQDQTATTQPTTKLSKKD